MEIKIRKKYFIVMLNIPNEVTDWLYENRRNFVKCALFVMVVALACNACQYFNDKTGMKDDNFVEEVVESIIQKNTGIDVDLTPRSPE